MGPLSDVVNETVQSEHPSDILIREVLENIDCGTFFNILGKGIQEMNLFHNKQIKDDLCVKDSFLN